MIRHIKGQRAKAVVVVPEWPSMWWWPLLMEGRVDPKAWVRLVGEDIWIWKYSSYQKPAGLLSPTIVCLLDYRRSRSSTRTGGGGELGGRGEIGGCAGEGI